MGHHGHHHDWEHHHGHHHHGMGRGMFFFPFVPLIISIFVMFIIFKTGLWIPLLLIGAFMFFCRPRMGMGMRGMGRGGWGSMNRSHWQGKGMPGNWQGKWGKPEEWQAMREKMKREWGQWQGDESTPEEKPKRSSDGIEYV